MIKISNTINFKRKKNLLKFRTTFEKNCLEVVLIAQREAV